MSNLLRAENIYKSYKEDGRENAVLRGLELEVDEGEIIVIMGPSGSGKTTLIHILGGLDKPDQGRVLIDGIDLFVHSDLELSRIRNAKIGFIFQFHQLLPEFTAVENVMLPTLIGQGNAPPKLRENCVELLELVGLSGKENKLPSHLSCGEQQRVGVARALVNKPKIVLVDEPTGNLDRGNSKALDELFKKLNVEYKVTFIIGTHKEPEIASRVLKLEDGKLKEI